MGEGLKKNRTMLFMVLLVMWGGLFLPMAVVPADDNVLVISSAMQYDYAITCFERKDYETAVIEFKRFIHFFPESGKIRQARFNTGMAQHALGKYHDAARTFNEIIVAGKDDALTLESCFMQAESFVKLENYGYAQIVLQNIILLADDSDTKDRAYGTLADIYLERAMQMAPDALETARGFLDQISESNAVLYHKQERIALIDQAQTADQKNPALAGILSVVPGMGFLYTERYHDAFMTFCLNAGLILAAYQAHENSNNALAGVLVFVETGFYSGNIYGSITAAHKFNRARRTSILGPYFSLSPQIHPEDKRIGLSLTHRF